MKLPVLLLHLFLLWQEGRPLSEKQGKATYYADSLHGSRTASGERYNKHHFTAAHATLPFHTVVRLTNLDNGKTVYVKINDRGPSGADFLVDLSKAAAEKLDILNDGTATVKLEELPRVSWPERYRVVRTGELRPQKQKR